MASNEAEADSSAELSNPRKTLFSTPVTPHGDVNISGVEVFPTRFHLDADTEGAKHKQEQQIHKQRLDTLRQLTDELTQTDWIYDPIEKLIGLQ